jgi:glutaredoxin
MPRTIYLKSTCPFCLKLRIFLTEAGLADRFSYVIFNDDDQTLQAFRQRMQQAGQEASFPAVAFESERFETGTDALIARFAAEAGVDPGAMPLLTYYDNGVLERYSEMYIALRELKPAS